MTQHFASGGQTTGAPVSASVLVVNIQGRFPLGLIGFISLQSKGLLRVYGSGITSEEAVQESSFLKVPQNKTDNIH